MLNQAKVRVGFIGAGWAERVQIPMFRRGGLIAQAIASANPENAKRAAQKLEVPLLFENWQDLVASDQVDLVSIVTPPHLHAEMAIAALRAGKHVICEKPTAMNVAEAEQMLAAAQAAPSQLGIIDHELRFHPPRMQLRQLLREGYVGNLLTLHLDRLGSERLNPAAPWTWLSDAKQGGGMLGAVGSHLLDLARWLVGRIEAITGQLQTGHYHRVDTAGVRHEVTADDHAHLLVKFATGVQGTFTISSITPGGYGMSITAVGTEGALRLDNQDRLWGARGEDLHKGNWQPIELSPPDPAIADLGAVSPFFLGTFYLAKRLAQALPAGETLINEAASFYDGLVVQRALDAARRAHVEKIWVRL